MINKYFNHFDYQPSQDLIESLVIEFIQTMGQDVYYMPRELVNYDQLFGEDVLNQFTKAIEIEMYPENIEFNGQGSFLSKFGLQNQRGIDWIVSQKRFLDELHEISLVKPRIGDIIYSHLFKMPFEITYVDEYSLVQQPLNSKVYSWKVNSTLLTYSHENINTGIPEIDRIETENENTIDLSNIINADNVKIKEEFNEIKDFNAFQSPFGEY